MTRYQAYRDTGIEWLSQVPMHWGIGPLFVAVNQVKAKNSFLAEENLLSLSHGQIVRKSIEANDGLLPESFDTYQIVESGDIIYRFTDLQNDKRSLRSALVTERGIITSAYLAVRPRSHLPSFLAYLSRAYDSQKVFYAMGGGLRQSMKFEDVRRLPVVTPPVDEQRQIVEYLDRETRKIDQLISMQQALVKTLSVRRRSLVDEVIVRGMRGQSNRVTSEHSWLGEVPANWRMRPLWSLFSKVKDVGHPEETMLSVFREHGVVPKDLYANLNQTAENRDIYQLVGPGWLIANRMKAWQGSVGVSQLRGIVSGHYICFRPTHNESHFYLNYLFRSGRYTAAYKSISRGVRTGQAEIDNEKYRVLPVLLPGLDEQHEIVAYLDEVSEQTRRLSMKADELAEVLRERRSALILAAVTGKIDVRGL